MEKEYKFPALPKECKVCGLKLSGRRVELGSMRGSQPMGYCPECGYSYQIVEIESEPSKPAPEPEPVAEVVAKEKAPEVEVEVTPPPEPEP
ncbi:hypothetical protein ES703_111179 [subsurface metagenome]